MLKLKSNYKAKKMKKITVELTPRLMEVAKMLLCGKSKHEISQMLGISPETAANHRYSVLGRCVGNLQRSGERMNLPDFINGVNSGDISLVEYCPDNFRLSEEDKKHIIKLHKIGLTTTQVAKRTGFSQGKVSMITRQQRLQDNSKKSSRKY